MIIEEKLEESAELEQVVGGWKLLGIMEKGSNRSILIFVEENGELIDLQIGETLPDGEQIVAIEGNSVRTTSSDETNLITLFQDLSNGED